MIGFIYALQEAGIPVSVRYVLDLYRALKRGLAPDLDRFFLLARLILVKRMEHLDAFEQLFAAWFLGAGIEPNFEDLEEAFAGKPFEAWLQEMIRSGRMHPDELREFDNEALLVRFWETVLAQEGAHHGGKTWVGTGGRSPYGHGGQLGGGIRVHGEGLYGTAQKVIGERRHVNYSDRSGLGAQNLRQALAALKSLRPVGPETELNIEETIARTAKNGGEIELVFRREWRNRVRLIVLLDNGGQSMTPYIALVKRVFNHLRDLFEHLNYYYFHNCIYGTVYRDPPRTQPVEWEKLVNRDRRTRLVVIGDANMAPAELMMAYGSLGVFAPERKPCREWLGELRSAFPVSVWLNPIPKERWGSESTTIRQIGRIFHMEDLTLAGIKNAVDHLNHQGQTQDRI